MDFYFIAMAVDVNKMLEFTDCLHGAKVEAKIYDGGYYTLAEIDGSTVEKEAYEQGKQI